MIAGGVVAGGDVYNWAKKYYIPSKPWVKKWPQAGVGRFAGRR